MLQTDCASRFDPEDSEGPQCKGHSQTPRTVLQKASVIELSAKVVSADYGRTVRTLNGTEFRASPQLGLGLLGTLIQSEPLGLLTEHSIN